MAQGMENQNPPDDEVVAHSRILIEKGSKSFARAARLFDPATRDSVTLLYAWCRYCDDLIDGQHLGFPLAPDEMRADDLETRVALLRGKTIAAYDGFPEELEFQALARVVKTHDIPRRYPLDLIEGFAMDAADRHYDTIEDTLSYCYHVAGVVGVMMAIVMGARAQPTLERACDLGIAFQLTNIARDVIADRALGRVYLPEEWLREAGVAPEDLAEPENRAKLFGVVDRLLAVADRYYDSAGYGLADLPYRSAWSIAAARRIYREIGQEVRRRGAKAWDDRVSTSDMQKLRIVASGGIEAASARSFGRLRAAPPRDQLWTPIALRDNHF
jgi:15-cis-phytoene synthase